MQTTNEFLDAVKARHGFKSDYELAKALGVKQQTISNYRARGTSMDNTMATKVAELLVMKPMEVIAAAEIERAERMKDEKAKGFWMRYAAALLVAVGVSAPPSPAEASTAGNLTKTVSNTDYTYQCGGAAIQVIHSLAPAFLSKSATWE